MFGQVPPALFDDRRRSSCSRFVASPWSRWNRRSPRPVRPRQLADLGPRVIKVERPGAGDFARGYDHRVKRAELALRLGQPQQGVAALDVKDPRGRAVLLRCSRSADVFVQNLAPGATARMGSARTSCRLRTRGDRLRHLRLRPRRPVRAMKAYDLMVQSEAGWLSVTGTPTEMAKSASRSPTSPPACTLQRVARGAAGAGPDRRGSVIDVSMLESRGVDGLPARLLVRGRAAAPPRRRARHHLPVRPVHRRRRQDRDYGIHNEREWARFC